MKKWRLWIGAELVWCEETDEPGRYKLLNDPAFTNEYKWGDILDAEPSPYPEVLILKGATEIPEASNCPRCFKPRSIWQKKNGGIARACNNLDCAEWAQGTGHEVGAFTREDRVRQLLPPGFGEPRGN